MCRRSSAAIVSLVQSCCCRLCLSAQGFVVSANLLLYIEFVYASLCSQVIIDSTDDVVELPCEDVQHVTHRSDGVAKVLLT